MINDPGLCCRECDPPCATPAAPDCPGDRDEACVICGYGSSEHTGAGEMIHEFRPGDRDQRQAAEVTGCRPWGGAGAYCVHQRHDIGQVPWNQCRWVPVVAALAAARAEEAARWQAKIEAALSDRDVVPRDVAVDLRHALLDGER